MIKAVFQDKRFAINFVILLTLAFLFWFGSRYPALGEKARMGGDSGISGIGFDEIHQVEENDPLWEQVFWTTLNWAESNRKGMVFGLLFATSIALAMKLIPRKSFNNPWGNALLGFGIGTPLGVCVNCVAPIAKGMHRGGSRIETTLATLFASPTMNIIVLSMLFALLPWYYSITKIVLTLGLILIALPWLTKHYFNTLAIKLPKKTNEVCSLPTSISTSTSYSWGQAITWFIKSYLRELALICLRTVPLMFLAGFLGAIAITLIPWDNLSQFLPSQGHFIIFLAMFGLAIASTFLPVPIAFDVIVVTILLGLGIQSHYAMVLLFTLGTYSIYSHFIVSREISFKVSSTLFTCVVLLGTTSGVVVHFLEQWELNKQKAHLIREFKQLPPKPLPMVHSTPAVKQETIDRIIEKQTISFQYQAQLSTPAFTISSHELSRKKSPHATFIKEESKAFGFESPYRLSFDEFIWLHAEQTRAIASGDIHNDGWTDIVVTLDNYEGGFALLANNRGKQFVRQPINLGSLSTSVIRLVALVDFNNDGWLDIFFTTHLEGNYLIYNDHGSFKNSTAKKLPSKVFAHVNAAAFGDVNEDGRIDIVLGYWSHGFRKVKNKGMLSSTNQVLLQNTNHTFTAKDLPGYPAETHSLLLSDFTHDGHLDLIVGNDFTPSDIYYRGKGDGTFTKILNREEVIPETPTTTMSLTSADLNNDLQMEILGTQISMPSADSRSYEKIPIEDLWEQFDDPEQQAQNQKEAEIAKLRLKILKNSNPMFAYQYASPDERNEALALAFYERVLQQDDKELRMILNQNWKKIRGILSRTLQTSRDYTPSERKESIPQISRKNTLLIRSPQNKWENQATFAGLEYTDWSWSSRFSDFDNDQFQDLYVVNGYKSARERASNFYFKNEGGLQFSDQTSSAGLVDYLATTGATYLDYDNDGDLDIITTPTEGPIHVFTNHLASRNSIQIILQDFQGNRFAIGAKVIIRYGEDATHQQMREIQSSGGFLSFDAPIAHFGLGEHTEISQVEIEWPDGQKNTFRGVFKAGYFYKIERK